MWTGTSTVCTPARATLSCSRSAPHQFSVSETRDSRMMELLLWLQVWLKDLRISASGLTRFAHGAPSSSIAVSHRELPSRLQRHHLVLDHPGRRLAYAIAGQMQILSPHAVHHGFRVP